MIKLNSNLKCCWQAPESPSKRGLGIAVWEGDEGCVLKRYLHSKHTIDFDHIFTCGDFERWFMEIGAQRHSWELPLERASHRALNVIFHLSFLNI